MGNSKLFLVFIMCFVSIAFGTRCLQIPRSLSSGQKCGGSAVSCAYGLVCKSNGLCGSQVAIGEACILQSECPPASSCRAGKCVANLNPGENCNSTAEDSPVCGSGLSCDLSFFGSGVCEEGSLGDSCISNSDCRSFLNCTNSICSGALSGERCTGSGSGTFSGCHIGLYCDRTNPSAPICRPRLTSGKCSSDTECKYGYSCVGTTPSDDRQCVAFQSRSPGEYCGFQSSLCKDGGRCQNSYCTEKSPKFCGGSSECATDESCTCSGANKLSGIGSCTKNKCFDEFQVRMTCLQEKCGEAVPTMAYSGSCAFKNCKDEIEAHAKCSSSTRVVLSAFLLVASLLVLFF